MYMKLKSFALLLLVSTAFTQIDNQIVNTNTPTPTVQAQYSIVTVATSLPSCTIHPHCPTIPVRCPDDCPKLCYVSPTDACCPYVGQLTCTNPEGNSTTTATTIVSTGNTTASLNGTIVATSTLTSGNSTNTTGSSTGNGTTTTTKNAGGSLKATKISNGWIVAAAGLVAAFVELAL